MGKKAPAPPDYASLAEQTAAASREATTAQTWANRADQTTPWGSLTWESSQVIDPATGQPVTKWHQNVQLTPEEQAALDAQRRVQLGKSEMAEGMMGRLPTEAWDTDQYGDPIGLGDTARLSGAGEGIQTQFSAGRNPASAKNVNTNVRKNFQFDDRGLDTQQLQTDLDFSGAPSIDDPRFTQERAEQSVYERGASRLDPQFAQEEQALSVRLQSQGLSPGDAAYDAQMRNFQDRKSDAYANLERQAQQEGFDQARGMFGMQSQHRGQMTGETAQQGGFRNQALQGQFGMDMGARGQDFDIANAINQFAQTGDIQSIQAALQQRGQNIDAQTAFNQLGLAAQGMGNAAQQQAFQQRMLQAGFNNDDIYRANALANQLRSQNIGEDLMFRNQPLNELNAFLTGQQVSNPQFGSYNQAGRAEHANYLGAGDMQFQGDMARFGANQAMMNSILSGASNIGAGMATGGTGFFSDRRLKSNIEKIGERNGTNWYKYEIFGQPQIGVMADEVPHAAFMHPSGYLMVDYRRV
jgi:hypothetical protein